MLSPMTRTAARRVGLSITVLGVLGLLGLLGGLAGCGDTLAAIPDEILPADTYFARCEHPRSGIDPTTGRPFLDVDGSLLDEQLWIRSWTDDTYLWYREVPNLDIRTYSTAVGYFEDLKTPAKTA